MRNSGDGHGQSKTQVGSVVLVTVASSIVDREDDSEYDQLEGEGDVIRQVLLLGYRSGFQVWDVEEADNVRDLVSKREDPVSFMQMLPKLEAAKRLDDKFADSRPLLVVCADGPSPGTMTYRVDVMEAHPTMMLEWYCCAYRCPVLFLEISIVCTYAKVQISCLFCKVQFSNCCCSSSSSGYGPVAVGPRWLAYSGSPVVGSDCGRELSRYLPDSYNYLQSGSPGWKGNGTVNGHLVDVDNIGMGHNINVFKIMPGPGNSSACDTQTSYTHLYRLQRGITNAVIQDISFSDDSNRIMISSSRGTIHLFAINPMGGSVCLQSGDADFAHKNGSLGVMTKPQVPRLPNSSLCASGPPVTLSVVSRIRNGSNGWRGTVSGAAAAATGRMGSLSGAIACSFHNCKGNNFLLSESSSLKGKYHLLVFSPSGCMIQYALRPSAELDSTPVVTGLNTTYESTTDSDVRLVVEAIQKWNICQKHTRRERDDNVDIYGENGTLDNNKVYPEEAKDGKCMRLGCHCGENHRIRTVYSNSNGHLLHQRSGPPENGRLSHRTCSGSLDTVTENGAPLSELHTSSEGTSLNGPNMPP
ncbi:Autophagy 18 F isoform 2 [Hibiscus syriacus]|uniref:Autophagy 18 F isoform 2 n=1 Tax=Hibiscus syriacus TaxID=106335 RepID=A0A6A3AHJ7_HIBSY|nr:Autophagy 18 F isoform 2 [Hibiscus syriacus]